MSLRHTSMASALILLTQSLMAILGASTVVCMQNADAPKLEVLFGWSEGCCAEHDHAGHDDARHDDARHDDAGHESHAGHDHLQPAEDHPPSPACSCCAPAGRSACACLHLVLPSESSPSVSKLAAPDRPVTEPTSSLRACEVERAFSLRRVDSAHRPPPDPERLRLHATAHVLLL